MQRPLSAKVPTLTVAVQPLPPMYAWPISVKRVVLAACIILCIIAYVAMTAGILSLATLILGLL
jgi:hypothetical protein